MRSACNAVKYLRFSSNRRREDRTVVLRVNQIALTLAPQKIDILEAKTALLKSVSYATEYTICILVPFAIASRPILGPTEPASDDRGLSSQQ
jgi:hypothetical protein